MEGNLWQESNSKQHEDATTDGSWFLLSWKWRHCIYGAYWDFWSRRYLHRNAWTWLLFAIVALIASLGMVKTVLKSTYTNLEAHWFHDVRVKKSNEVLHIDLRG